MPARSPRPKKDTTAPEVLSVLHALPVDIARSLQVLGERVVLAESCTCGLVASTLGRVPGISSSLCGSAVVYRADSKKRWLGITKREIERFTTESAEMAKLIAMGILSRTPEANWGIGVVGHLGPEAPPKKDGLLYLCIIRRTKKGKLKIKEEWEHALTSKDRAPRQQEAVEVVLTHFARILEKKMTKEKLQKS